MTGMQRPRWVTALLAGALLVLIGLLAGPAGVAGAQDEKPTIAATMVYLETGDVELTNYGDADVDPNGLILCNFPSYAPIEGADMIPAGGSIMINAIDMGLALDAAGGEFGIYTVPEYTNADAIVSYVEWGEPGHERAGVAESAGVWAEGVAVPTDGVIAASTSNPTSPADWSGAAAEPAAEEDAEAVETTEELAATGAEQGQVAVVALALIVAGVAMLATRRRVLGNLS